VAWDGRGFPWVESSESMTIPKDVPAPLKLYLDGKIEQFFYRQDKSGVIFVMNVDSVEQVEATVDALPPKRP
jgi:hypothetical protein